MRVSVFTLLLFRRFLTYIRTAFAKSSVEQNLNRLF
jgi:hypothetical protein